MAKRNDESDIAPLIYLGIASLAYFGVIQPLFNIVGITKSPEKQKVLNENDAATKAEAWKPYFYKNYRGVKHLLTDASIAALARRVYNAWGYVNDDENAIYGVFRELHNLLQLSQLSDKYLQLYNTDLLTRLHNPWYKSNDGLDDDEFNVIAKIVNALPVNG